MGVSETACHSSPWMNTLPWVATSSYLFEKGGQMPALWEPAGEPIPTGIMIRDALIAAARAVGPGDTLAIPALGRIRRAEGGAR